jgi:dTDP-4-dehydrorhamnose 3,5-epimerase
VFIPAGCAHGFVSLTDHATVAYLIAGDYQPAAAATLRWNDPSVGIEWPVCDPVLSDADRTAPDFLT